MTQTINIQNLQQKSFMSLMIKIIQTTAKEMKMMKALNLKQVIKWNLCDYSDAYILVAGDIIVVNSDNNTNVALKNCAAFTKCITHINDEHIDIAENLDIIIPR